MKVSTELEELGRSITNSIIAARQASLIFKEREAMRKKEAAKIAQEKEEQQLLRDLKPILEKIPKEIIEAGNKGLNIAYIYLYGSDFDPRPHNRKPRDHKPRDGTTTAKLISYLTKQQIAHRIIWDSTTDSGAYNEQFTYYHYKLEIKF